MSRAGWIVAVFLAAVLAWGGVEYGRLWKLTARYAGIIAAAANGGEFAIEENWLVSCKGRRVVVY